MTTGRIQDHEQARREVSSALREVARCRELVYQEGKSE